MYSSLIGYGELPHAEEDEEDKVKPLPDWNSSKAQELPPEVDPKKLERACTPSYYLLPDNVNSYKPMCFLKITTGTNPKHTRS